MSSVAAAIFLLQGCERTGSTDIFGLTAADKRLGGPVDIELLRKSAEAAADAHISGQSDALKKFSGGPYTVAIDYSQIPLLRSHGYTSSFYYFCWDLSLPYRLITNDRLYTLVVQVTDRSPGNKHDINKFHVIRMKIIDEQGQVKETFDSPTK